MCLESVVLSPYFCVFKRCFVYIHILAINKRFESIGLSSLHKILYSKSEECCLREFVVHCCTIPLLSANLRSVVSFTQMFTAINKSFLSLVNQFWSLTSLWITHASRSMKYIYILECSPMARETRVQSPVESYQRLKKWYLMPPCLTLSIIRYGSRIKWSNPGKGVAPSPTYLCSSYWKGSLRVTLDYGRQLIHIYIYWG